MDRKNYQLKSDDNATVYNQNILDKKATINLVDLYKNGTKVGDTHELIDVHLALDPYGPYLEIFGREFKFDYLNKEHNWYMHGAETGDLSIKGYMDDIKIWNFCASKDEKAEINSNYGVLVFNEKNFSQFDSALSKLKENKNTREAMIIYTRPSIQTEATENGKHDFICTNYSHFFIRDGQLIMIHSQRSCDIVTGFSFDWPWTCLVYQLMYEELKETYPDLRTGLVYYNIDSLHFYDRSIPLVDKYIERLDA